MNPAELKAVVEYMESDRGVSREVIIRAIELALESASGRNGEQDPNIRIAIDRTHFQMKAYRRISDGSEIETTPQSLGRIAAQTAKQVIMQKIRLAEKELLLDEYKDRVGEILTGTVVRFERSDVIVELDHGEATLLGRERVPTEEYEIGERIRAVILEVRERERGPEIVLSGVILILCAVCLRWKSRKLETAPWKLRALLVRRDIGVKWRWSQMMSGSIRWVLALVCVGCA